MKVIEYNPAKKKRNPGIPAGFKDQLIHILQTKYLEEDWALPAVQDHIRQQHQISIEERPLTYFIQKNNLQKRKYQDSTQSPATTSTNQTSPQPGASPLPCLTHGFQRVENSLLSPASASRRTTSSEQDLVDGSTVPLHSEHDVGLDPGQSSVPTDTEDPTVTTEFDFSSCEDSTMSDGLTADTENSSVEITSFSNATPDISPEMSLDPCNVHKAEADINLDPVDGTLAFTSGPWSANEPEQLHFEPIHNEERFSAFSIAERTSQDLGDTHETEQKSHLQQMLSDTLIKIGKDESVVGRLSKLVKQQPNRIRRRLPTDSLLLKPAHGPVLSIPPSTNRISLISEIMLTCPKLDVDIINMSSTEVKFMTELVVALLCCGWISEAIHCCDSLVTCLRRQASSGYDQSSAENRYFCLTKLLIWIIPFSPNKMHILPLLDLWETFHNVRNQRMNAFFFTAKGYQATDLFAMGSLALTAMAYGHQNFADKVLAFWHLGMSEIMADRQSGKASPQTDSLKYLVDFPGWRHAKVWRFYRPYFPKSGDMIWVVVEAILRWVREQLLLASDLSQQLINSTELWYQAYHCADPRSLERQLLVAYLSFRGSEADCSRWTAHVDAEVFDLLPWRICEEWLSLETPMLTIAILAHMFEMMQQDQGLPMPSSIDGWKERMLASVNMLTHDMHYTVSKFYAIVYENNFQELAFCQTVNQTTSSPNVDTITPSMSAKSAFDAVLNTALFGFHVPTQLDQKRVPGLDALPPGPPLIDTPRSSMSGMRSLKSIYERTKSGVSRASLTSFGSQYFRRYSLVGSSMENLLGPLMRSSFASGRSGLSSRLRHGHDEKMAIDHGDNGDGDNDHDNDDMMDVDP